MIKTTPNCPFCQTKILRSLYHVEGRIIYQCPECGLICAASEILNGQLSPKTEARRKKKDYQKKEENWYQTYLEEKTNLLSRFEKRLEEIEKRRKPGKVLDVGCGPGFFLEVAQKHGWEIFGLDILERTLIDASCLLPASHLFYGPLEKAFFQDRFFDTIVFFETLEHMSDLHQTLSRARKILKDDGLLAITVPNRAGWISKMMGKSWFDYQRLQHLYFFTPETLKMILNKNGFKIIYQGNELAYRCFFSTLCSKIRRYYPNPFLKPLVKTIEMISQSVGPKSIIIPIELIYVLCQKA